MGISPPTVVILSRATRLVGALCIVIWLIAGGITMFEDPVFSARPTSEMIRMLEPSIVLYLLPGLFLFVLGSLIKAGRLWPAPIILLISILSLFKLVLLLVPIHGVFFDVPRACEVPARIACAMLCVPCVFAWEDLVEANRTRSRRRKYGLLDQPLPPAFQGTIHRKVPPPPPPSRVLRPRNRPDEPPSSQTPWS